MKSNVKLTVIYDNNPMQKDLQTDWGFSCLIETINNKILFDTGDNGSILLKNMEKHGIDPKSIDIVFLSHFHHDHTGGLRDLLKINSKVKVFYPKSFPKEIIDAIISSNTVSVPVSDFLEILPDVYSLGEIDGNIPEQSLAIRSSAGIVIITGCAHPGILSILQKAKSDFPDELVYLALGGFHLHRLNEEEITEVIRKMFDMKIQLVAPTHCTGNTARTNCKDVFVDNYIEVGIGKVITID
jgi:7,8-dihydropterin-6-yl-methyl-4-(beta-D-ribofuranosyl)aminobenzene 5'-phosphate synthase